MDIYNNADGTGDWDDPANWTQGVPNSNSNVDIEAEVDYVSNNDASVANATFSDNATWSPNWWQYISLNVTGTTTFDGGSSFTYGEIDGNGTVVMNDGSYLNGGGNIYANTIFYGNSYSGAYGLDGVNNTFNDSSYNVSNIYYGNAIFNGNSYNDGYIAGNATFNDGSYNEYSEIDGTATFNSSSEGSSYDYDGYLTVLQYSMVQVMITVVISTLVLHRYSMIQVLPIIPNFTMRLRLSTEIQVRLMIYLVMCQIHRQSDITAHHFLLTVRRFLRLTIFRLHTMVLRGISSQMALQ